MAAWMAKQVELALDGVGLSLPQYRLLLLLDAGPTVSSALADRLAVRPPSVTAVVDGLVARGLVARAHREDDRRRVSHDLTAEGRRLLAEADRAVDDRLGAIARCLPDADQARRATGALALWQEALLAHRDRVVGDRAAGDRR
ncbi:MAG: MarR family winged helix-turn-helix transcriptional regulator [Acidimicrobiales bacterium]